LKGLRTEDDLKAKIKIVEKIIGNWNARAGGGAETSAHHHWPLHGLLARQKDSVRLNSALCTECKHVDTDW